MDTPTKAPATGSEPRLTQAQRTARTRSLLLRAALDLIAEGGYQNASLANIGKRAGYSRGVVTHTFGCKANLLADLVARMTERWSNKNLSPAIGDHTGAEALCITIDEMVNISRESEVDTRALYVLLFEALGPLPELKKPFAALHEGLRANTANWIQAGIDNGSINPEIEPTAQAGLYMGAVRGILYQWLLDDSFDLEAAFEEQKKTIRLSFRP